MYVCVVFKCLCLYVCVRVHIAYLEVVQWCLPMPDSLVTARWLENLRFKTLHVVKKLEETVGSHHNFVPLEALPIPMLSEYHRIISDSQLYDVIPLNNGFLQPLGKHPSTPNHLRNGTLLVIFFKCHQPRITRKARGIVAGVWSAVSMELWMLSEMNCTKPLPGKLRYVNVDGANIRGSLRGMFL